MKGGIYLKKLRLEANLSQTQMAKIIGKRNERISEWESDVHSIKLIDFIEIAKKLEISDFNKILNVG
ncbi:helix-turn-helix domain-containing protein [Tenacibaculum agarivorans]|uniref:helix-turn-helix domain-containing protein n=1 Tax=Tenacibaculum agarivorans TaxID=1908389 RepID=UPI00094B8B47|nr:helix-turn-helix transcriptional regulator [Tenacibaculum agarivorans]